MIGQLEKPSVTRLVPAEAEVPARRGRAAYLCLQATREGQASHAHVHEILNGLRSRGWEVELFEPGYAGTSDTPGYLGKLWSFLSVQQSLWRRARQADVWYIRAHHLALPTALYARLVGVPTVQEVNGPHEDLFVAYPWIRPLALLMNRSLDAALALSAAIIVVTPELKTWVASRIRQKRIEVISNGANVDTFHPGAPLNRRVPDPYAVFFGVLQPWQGVSTLCEAVQQPEWPADLKLVILGDGPERAEVEAAAAKEPKIVPLGSVPYRDVPGIVANSVMSIIPKNNLGDRKSTGLSPLKLYESLACGVPVVVTDLPGQADLVREFDCGRIVPAGDSEGIARAVRELYADETLRQEMGHRGREGVVRAHSWAQRSEVTCSLLETLIHAQGVRRRRWAGSDRS
jgi:glycosyltransferase involved in cell wall biosynthesis